MNKTIPTEPISRFAFTAAIQTTACPKCGAQPGEVCVTPQDRRSETPHVERTAKYAQSISKEEFAKRHSINVKLPQFLEGEHNARMPAFQ